MLVFITAIRHPDSCSDYPLMLQLVQRTIDSVCSQTHPDYRLIICCQEQPDLKYDPAYVEFVLLEREPVSLQQDKEYDKELRYRQAFLASLQYKPSHIMIFDCDDLIHHDLCQFVHDHPEANGWYFDTGYISNLDFTLLSYKKENFHLHNGSSNIIRTDLLLEEYEITSHITDGSSDVFRDHKHHVTRQDKGLASLEPLPFPGSVWVLGSGMNVSGLDFFGAPKITPQELRKQFGQLPLKLHQKVICAGPLFVDISKKILRKMGILKGNWGPFAE